MAVIFAVYFMNKTSWLAGVAPIRTRTYPKAIARPYANATELNLFSMKRMEEKNKICAHHLRSNGPSNSILSPHLFDHINVSYELEMLLIPVG